MIYISNVWLKPYKNDFIYQTALRENGRLPCVKMFAVRFSSGARQTSTLPCVFRMTHGKQKRTVSIYFAVRFYGGARQSLIFAVRFPRDARQFCYANVW
jgi:hypothetical protein